MCADSGIWQIFVPSTPACGECEIALQKYIKIFFLFLKYTLRNHSPILFLSTLSLHLFQVAIFISFLVTKHLFKYKQTKIDLFLSLLDKSYLIIWARLPFAFSVNITISWKSHTSILWMSSFFSQLHGTPLCGEPSLYRWVLVMFPVFCYWRLCQMSKFTHMPFCNRGHITVE